MWHFIWNAALGVFVFIIAPAVIFGLIHERCRRRAIRRGPPDETLRARKEWMQ